MKAYYQEIAPDYARLRRIHPEVFRHVRERGGIQRDSRVLEIGCGTGNYICALREAIGCDCWGVDQSDQMLAQAKPRNADVHFAQARAEDTQLPPESFDLVFSVDVIHHVADRPQSFREARRVLRPGGRICIVTDSEYILRNRQPQSFYFPESVDVELARYPAIPLLEKELIEAGFREPLQELVEWKGTLENLDGYRAKVFSSLKLISQEAFDCGLAKLESDFKKGPIPWISRYVILWATK